MADRTRRLRAGRNVMIAHREVTGLHGVGLFPLWGPPQSFSGVNYTIGRHAFTRAEIAVGDGVAGYALMVRVKETEK